ncbi:transcription activator GCR1-like domain-containing protein Ecym_1260 [Eremothecium cymbalariae DBVPG|uniref:Transcription activator GCR1-like domain-containing protein n=1 Tax=Eremothecium cymbalariae (strain CBS 270.75 / DBVPG 7215 / KCTC 17166 / NRRL Y-17582) TaxID=931890 RepID=G8JN38_ERECY|nr:hypothetical protein Ecym_1260 [Eremothecium cymbalariae DBVPG\
MSLSNEISPLDITSTNIKHVNRMFQEMEVRMAHLQRQVDTLRIHVRQEHMKRKILESKLVTRFSNMAKRLTERLTESSSSDEDEHDSEDIMPFDQQMDVFESMFDNEESDSSYNESGNDSLSSEKNVTDVESEGQDVSEQRNNTASMLDTLVSSNTHDVVSHVHPNGTMMNDELVSRHASTNESSAQLSTAGYTTTGRSVVATSNHTASSATSMPPAQLVFDAHHPQEDLALLINDALNGYNGAKKRSLSNDFNQQQQQSLKKRWLSVASYARMPIFPLKPYPNSTPTPASTVATTPITNNNAVSSSSPPAGTPPHGKRYDEVDIRSKYGVSFSEKYFKVSEIWNDYIKVNEKGVSIKSLEESYSNKWRANLKKNVKKKYNRRLIVVRAIETGIKRGKSQEECIEILDGFLKQNNKAVSHFYKKSNLPKELI